jgi:hypothetical protein
MSLIKLRLNRMSVADKIQFGRQIVLAMTDNPNFPGPTPSLPTLEAGSASLETAYNDAQTLRQAAKAKTTVQDDRSTELDWELTQLAGYVEMASDGDKAKIESAGFSVRNPPAPIGELPPPVDLQVVPSDHAGTADVRWQQVFGAKAYSIERANDAPELDWTVIGNSTKKQATLNSMVSGTKYWFRVAAIGAAGQSAYSDPVPLFAP